VFSGLRHVATKTRTDNSQTIVQGYRCPLS
jgi:hypothetical protein